MNIISSAFENSGSIPAKYTCEGEDVNPPLELKNIPGEADSLALIVDDPDAPGGVFNHWLVWNIDPKAENMNEALMASGTVQGSNDFGEAGYRGPCPPSGEHRYVFKLYALNKKLKLKDGSGKKVLEEAIKGKIIKKAQLVGKYKKGSEH